MGLLDEIAGADGTDAYDNLPEPVKISYSRQEWLWLSDRQKVTLIERECVPETFED